VILLLNMMLAALSYTVRYQNTELVCLQTISKWTMSIVRGAFEIRYQNITLTMDSASLARRLLPAQLCLSLVTFT